MLQFYRSKLSISTGIVLLPVPRDFLQIYRQDSWISSAEAEPVTAVVLESNLLGNRADGGEWIQTFNVCPFDLKVEKKQ